VEREFRAAGEEGAAAADTSLGTHVDRQELAAIFLGGAIGALVRAGLAQGFPAGPGSWPWATFAVNVLAALALGYFITRLQERLPPYTYRRAFLGSGVCGALGTFSTMMLELLRMIDRGHWALALGYAGASLACGFAAVFVSSKLVRRARFAA
jgi:fluoride exporter